MSWHIETDIVAILFTAVIFLAMRNSFDRTKNRDLRFLSCLWINLINLVVDIAGSVVFDIPVSVPVFHITQTLYHSLNLLTIISWYHYCVAVIFEDKPALIRKTDVLSAIFYALYVLFVVSNLFTGQMYTYDAVAGYHRGPLFFVPVGCFALYALFIFGFAFFLGRRIADQNMRFALIVMPMLLGASIALQLSHSGWLVIFPFFTVGLLYVYLTIQQNRNDIVFKNLSNAAAHDALTGISNRTYAERAISDYLANVKGRDCALVILDLDNFKNINDTFGHDVGDQTLKQISRCLSGFFRGSDIVARYGGDEFLIFMPDTGDKLALRHRMSQLIVEISKLRLEENPTLCVSCSIGVAASKSGEDAFTVLLRQADAALYNVKRAGKNDFAFYTQDMDIEEYEHTRVDALTLKHSDWFDSAELKRLLYALSGYLPYVASINLDTGAYYAMENVPDVCDALPAYGEYNALLEAGFHIFHPADMETARNLFSLPSLQNAATENGKAIQCEARHRSKDGTWRWAQIICLFGPEESNGLPHAYLLVRPYEDDHNAAIERQRLVKVFELAVQTVFEYICLLNVADGTCTMFGNDGKNTHHIPEQGNYDQVTRTIRDTLVLPEEQGKFYKHAMMDNVEAELKKNGGSYSYLYRVKDGMRKASFYYNEDHSEILMTVQRQGTEAAAPPAGD